MAKTSMSLRRLSDALEMLTPKKFKKKIFSKDDEEDLFMEHEAREEVEEQHNKKTVVGSPADKELIETLQRENQELRANIEKLQEALSSSSHNHIKTAASCQSRRSICQDRIDHFMS